MAAKAPFGFWPALALHVVGADHHLVKVFHSVVDVVETYRAIHAGEGQMGIEKVDVVMVVRTITASENAEALLNV